MPLQRRTALKRNSKSIRTKMKQAFLTALIALALAVVNAFADETHTSSKFHGAKANTGTVTHMVKDGKNILTLSDDFKTPETPDPHWQVVDSKGNTYLLQKLKVKSGGLKSDKLNQSIVVPEYVRDVAKVQIWCAWAEAQPRRSI